MSEPSTPRGMFVAIEGPKSVGKSTLIDKLKTRSPEADTWVFTKEPTSDFDLGNEQRHTGRELAELIAADRARHVSGVIEPACRTGRVVLSDRYVLSSFVFHCLDGVAPSVVSELNAHFPRPDILLVLLCSPGTLKSRRSKRTPTRLANAIAPRRPSPRPLDTSATTTRVMHGSSGARHAITRT